MLTKQPGTELSGLAIGMGSLFQLMPGAIPFQEGCASCFVPASKDGPIEQIRVFEQIWEVFWRAAGIVERLEQWQWVPAGSGLLQSQGTASM